jgi:hypothetical protein
MSAKRELYRVVVKDVVGNAKAIAAETLVDARTIAERWKVECGYESLLFRWNADSQRYLQIPTGGR